MFITMHHVISHVKCYCPINNFIKCIVNFYIDLKKLFI